MDPTSEEKPWERFFWTRPLYDEVTLPKDLDLEELWGTSHRFDAYCVECGRDSIFLSLPDQSIKPPKSGKPTVVGFGRRLGVWSVEYACLRQQHRVVLLFRGSETGVVKIGQWPSLADLAIGETARFRKVVEQADLAELNRAIGLVAHGVGIGAFVYLRRIIERILFATYREQPTNGAAAVPLEEFQRMRVDDRFKLLRPFLPEFLAENPVVYKILSKGIHELNEQECLDAFPLLRTGIEEILEDRLELVEKGKRRTVIATQMGELNKKFAQRDDKGPASDGAAAPAEQ